VAEAIEAAGASLRHLPPYSPNYNPIENLLSKIKARLRVTATRAVDALGEAIDVALASVTTTDAMASSATADIPLREDARCSI
jgi:hypothetical protein